MSFKTTISASVHRQQHVQPSSLMIHCLYFNIWIGFRGANRENMILSENPVSFITLQCSGYWLSPLMHKITMRYLLVFSVKNHRRLSLKKTENWESLILYAQGTLRKPILKRNVNLLPFGGIPQNVLYIVRSWVKQDYEMIKQKQYSPK
jgi:hypothetical protein